LKKTGLHIYPQDLQKARPEVMLYQRSIVSSSSFSSINLQDASATAIEKEYQAVCPKTEGINQRLSVVSCDS
jgi:hypothetical protein